LIGKDVSGDGHSIGIELVRPDAVAGMDICWLEGVERGVIVVCWYNKSR
jgi:hypothetical protein